jgi:isopenicillin N synthase-like dioxygenase
MADIPVIDLETFFNKDANTAAYEAECGKVATALHNYGIVLLRDPRVVNKDNDTFLDMMEKYFEVSDGVRDAHPEVHYQVGVTPSHFEKARNHCAQMGAYDSENKPISPCPPEKDAKWRFFWRIGGTPEVTKYPALNMDPVVPPEFPEWTEVMNMWGNKMLSAVEVLATMTEVGFSLPADSLKSKMHLGPHLLAPTGSDFNKYGNVNHILAGFHSDLNLFTIHGKSRYPGLFAWTREGKRIAVAVPDGCLLVQAGKQMEYLTGGHVLAGFHEVTVTERTAQVIEQRKAEGKSLWRVSSTLFAHVASDQVLEPFPQFCQGADAAEIAAKYPAVDAGVQVKNELEAIELAVAH